MNSTTFSPHGKRYSLFTALTAGLAIGVCAAAAHAADPGASAPAVTVAYHDLNLATDAGNTALYARLEKAAAKVCVVADVRDLAALAARASCEQQALERAVRAVGSPRLAALLNTRAPQG